MTALMVVANQYGLNPWTKEIYAFPDRNNGIVPVVGVDGWSRIINEHQQFDGLEFLQDDESCTCIIYRKDRGHPVKVTEYLAECRREGQGPWKSHPRRMLRHKALIQCARLAFGYTGIYDQDEAERIAGIPAEKDVTPPKPAAPTDTRIPFTPEHFERQRARMQAALNNGGTTEHLISMIESKYVLDDAMRNTIEGMTAETPVEGEIV